MKSFLPFTRPDIDAASIAAVAQVLRSGQLASAPKVITFEQDLATYLGGGRHVRVMTSATAGLEMALQVAGVGPGDEVIVPAMSLMCSMPSLQRMVWGSSRMRPTPSVRATRAVSSAVSVTWWCSASTPTRT